MKPVALWCKKLDIWKETYACTTNLAFETCACKKPKMKPGVHDENKVRKREGRDLPGHGGWSSSFSLIVSPSSYLQ